MVWDFVYARRLLSNGTYRPIHDAVLSTAWWPRPGAPPRYLAQVKTDCLLTQRMPKRFTERLRALEALRHPDDAADVDVAHRVVVSTREEVEVLRGRCAVLQTPCEGVPRKVLGRPRVVVGRADVHHQVGGRPTGTGSRRSSVSPASACRCARCSRRRRSGSWRSPPAGSLPPRSWPRPRSVGCWSAPGSCLAWRAWDPAAPRPGWPA